jgi:hypothetical protein
MIIKKFDYTCQGHTVWLVVYRKTRFNLRHGVDHPPHVAEVKERVDLYFYSPLDPRGLF